jgi:hypothetical protein
MLRIRRTWALAAAVGGLALANGVRAAVVASDVASNSPYTAGTADNATTEFNGDNGGTGFGPWVVTDTENYTGTTPPPTTDNGPGNGNGEAFINSAAASGDTHNPGPGYFDVYDNGNPGSRLLRRWPVFGGPTRVVRRVRWGLNFSILRTMFCWTCIVMGVGRDSW